MLASASFTLQDAPDRRLFSVDNNVCFRSNFLWDGSVKGERLTYTKDGKEWSKCILPVFGKDEEGITSVTKVGDILFCTSKRSIYIARDNNYIFERIPLPMALNSVLALCPERWRIAGSCNHNGKLVLFLAEK